MKFLGEWLLAYREITREIYQTVRGDLGGNLNSLEGDLGIF